jgi:hypothetical protein
MSRKLRLVLGGNEVNRKRRQYGAVCWNLNGRAPASPPKKQPRRAALLVRWYHVARLVRDVTVENSVQAVDEAALDRLRHAIAGEDGEDEEEQLNAVLRMLEQTSLTSLSSPHFVGKAPAGQAPAT